MSLPVTHYQPGPLSFLACEAPISGAQLGVANIATAIFMCLLYGGAAAKTFPEFMARATIIAIVAGVPITLTLVAIKAITCSMRPVDYIGHERL